MAKNKKRCIRKYPMCHSQSLIFLNLQSARTPPLKALFASCYINSNYNYSTINSVSTCIKPCESAIICQAINMADWSGLCHDLLVLIVRSIALYKDFISFGGVCKSW